MNSLQKTRCINHASREAVARCPVCKQYFCRECITEHDGRVMCASCIQQTTEKTPEKKTNLAVAGLKKVTDTFKLFGGIILAWLFFYGIGQLLLLIPDSFHDPDFWRSL